MSAFTNLQPAISKAINDRRDSIISKWIARLKRDVAAAHELSDAYLIDHMPVFLDLLASSFAEPEDLLIVQRVRENAKNHGEQRTHSKYAVPQIIDDYIFLREIVIGEISIEPTKGEMLTLSRFFEAALGAAVEEFTSTQQSRSATENLRAIADAVLTLIIRIDSDFKYIFVNRAYEEWTGRPASQVLGRSVEDVVAPDVYPQLHEMMARALSGERITFEHHSPRGDGVQEHMLFTFVPAHDLEGKPAGVVITGQSIEQQKRAEVDAQERKHELANAFAQAPSPIALMIGPELVYTLANPPYVELTGRNPLGRKLRSAFTKEEAGPLIELVETVYKTGEPHFGKELEFNPQGASRIINVSYFPYRSTTGEIQGVLSFATDVTDQVRARNVIRDSELRLRAIFAHAAVGFAVSELSGEVIEANPRFSEIIGFTADEMRGRKITDFVHPDDLEMDRARLDELTSGRVDNFVIEKRFIKKDGSIAWVRNSVSLVRSPGVEPLVVRVAEDVTVIRETERELTQSRKTVESEQLKFRTLVAEATTPIAVLSGPDLTFEIANDAYLSLFNGRLIVGKPVLEALPELETQAFPRHLRSAYDGVRYSEDEALARLRRTSDGALEDRYFDQSYSQMLDQDGKPYGVFVQAVDVTEKVLARRRLEEVVERLQVAIEAAEMGTWDLNPQTGEILLSDRTIELFGMTKQENLPLMAAVEHIHPEDQSRVQAAIERAIDPKADSPDYNIEYRTVTGKGQVRWILAVGRASRAFVDASQTTVRFSGIVLDTTDRVMAEVAMRDAKERAELASAAKSSFLANMSHEIRTPLGAIMGFVSLIKDEGASPQTVGNYINVIERNSTQLMRIIDDILDLSKVEAGMMVIEHIDFSLVELLSDFASLMGFRAREKGIVFELKATTELPDVVNSDPTRIRQILTNIVGNAIKFTDSGSVTLRVSYENDHLTFDVTDTGRGIAQDQVARLFQPFSQADSSTTRKYGGTGLGLVLTRRLSEALGGAFNLNSSEEGVGSRFVSRIAVRLPERARFVRALGFASEPIRNAGVQGQLRDLRVLLVEDSPDNQALFSIYLNRAGAKIDIASDGQRGFEMAMSDNYDVVLMDVQMPIMDGITAVRKLRASGYSKPIVALTAHAMKEEKIRCLEAGYTGFLSKPIQRTELVDALAKFKAASREH